MKKKTRLALVLAPFTLLVVVLFFLWRGLSLQPENLPSALIGQPLPSFKLANIMNPASPLTNKQFKGHVSILHVFASWCSACEMEHPLLVDYKNKFDVDFYGIAYKDSAQNIKLFLKELGNPYTAIGDDASGDVSLDLGVYGTPETFIIDKQGVIVYRHVGILTQDVWDQEIWPMLQRLKKA